MLPHFAWITSLYRNIGHPNANLQTHTARTCLPTNHMFRIAIDSLNESRKSTRLIPSEWKTDFRQSCKFWFLALSHPIARKASKSCSRRRSNDCLPFHQTLASGENFHKNNFFFFQKLYSVKHRTFCSRTLAKIHSAKTRSLSKQENPGPNRALTFLTQFLQNTQGVRFTSELVQLRKRSFSSIIKLVLLLSNLKIGKTLFQLKNDWKVEDTAKIVEKQPGSKRMVWSGRKLFDYHREASSD